jgi:hypothetical protein
LGYVKLNLVDNEAISEAIKIAGEALQQKVEKFTKAA